MMNKSKKDEILRAIMQRRRPGKLAVFAVVAVMFFIVVGVWLFSGTDERSDRIVTAQVMYRDMIVEVRAVGELDAANSVILSSSVRGDKGKIIYLAEDGKQVKKDEVLVQLDSSIFEEEVLMMRSRVIELDALVDAQEQLLQWEKNQVEREIYRAESDMHIAKLELRRLEKGEGPREMARLEDEARKAREDYEQKKSYQDSLEELVQKGFSNPTEQDQIQKTIEDSRQAYRMISMQLDSYRDHLLPVQVEKARATITAAEVSLEQIKVGGGYKIGQAAASLERARQELEVARQGMQRAVQELKATKIVAPGPGMVVLAEQVRGNVMRKPRVGDQVWQNQPLVYLPDISTMIVNTQVREVDLHKIDVGKPVVARIDAYPELLLTGKVESIGVLADQGVDKRQKGKSFRVAITLKESDPRLRPGMTARVSIICDELSDIVAIPPFALFREGHKTFAFVSSGSGFEKRQVLVGAQNEDMVEIRSGLDRGERVGLSRPRSSDIDRTRLL